MVAFLTGRKLSRVLEQVPGGHVRLGGGLPALSRCPESPLGALASPVHVLASLVHVFLCRGQVVAAAVAIHTLKYLVVASLNFFRAFSRALGPRPSLFGPPAGTGAKPFHQLPRVVQLVNRPRLR
jgi:hypothetical protein